MSDEGRDSATDVEYATFLVNITTPLLMAFIVIGLGMLLTMNQWGPVVFSWPSVTVISVIAVAAITCGGTRARWKAAHAAKSQCDDASAPIQKRIDRRDAPAAGGVSAEIARLSSPLGAFRRAVDAILQVLYFPLGRFILPGIRASFVGTPNPRPRSRMNSVGFGVALTFLLHFLVNVPLAVWDRQQYLEQRAASRVSGPYFPVYVFIWLIQLAYVCPAHMTFAATGRDQAARGITLAFWMTMLLQFGLCRMQLY